MRPHIAEIVTEQDWELLCTIQRIIASLPEIIEGRPYFTLLGHTIRSDAFWFIENLNSNRKWELPGSLSGKS